MTQFSPLLNKLNRLVVICGTLLLLLLLMYSSEAQGQTGMRWVSIREIYAKGKHNAWPDMCRWKGRYYVIFTGHGPGHGPGGRHVVILSSADAETWDTVLDIPDTQWQLDEDETWPAQTLFFLPTDERLHVIFWSNARGDSEINPQKKGALATKWKALGGSDESFERWVAQHEASHRTRVTYSDDGQTWATPRPMLERGWWIWRPQTYEGRHYILGFRSHSQQWSITPELEEMIPRADSIAPLDPRRGKGMELFQSGSLFASDDGLSWQKVSDMGNNDDDEQGFAFGPGGRILAVMRNGAACKNAIAYVGDPPYQNWKTIQLDRTIHQPAVLYHQGHWIVGGRYIDEATFVPGRYVQDGLDSRIGTRLWFIDDETGALRTGTTLPSWGDSGQPAIVPAENGDLLVAYYACSETIDENLTVGGGPHPGKFSPCSIYLARVRVDPR